jgi:hypothetical protein
MKSLQVDSITLNQGDFIVIAENNRLSYGWFCGQGRGGDTLHYYSLWYPGNVLESFEEWEAGDNDQFRAEIFKKNGFTSKAFYKSYIVTYNDSRILKLENPDTLFPQNSDLEKAYKKSKEALIKVKFLNK